MDKLEEFKNLYKNSKNDTNVQKYEFGVTVQVYPKYFSDDCVQKVKANSQNRM